LLRQGEIRAWRSVLVDDPFRQNVRNGLPFSFRLVDAKGVVETAIFTDENNDVLDRAFRLGRIPLDPSVLDTSGLLESFWGSAVLPAVASPSAKSATTATPSAACVNHLDCKVGRINDSPVE
jgi:hypothetical protein